MNNLLICVHSFFQFVLYFRKYLFMEMDCTYLPYQQTGYFSKLITDYLQRNEALQPFYEHEVSIDGIKAAIQQRQSFPQNRRVLVDELKQQYQGLQLTPAVEQNIQSLFNPTPLQLLQHTSRLSLLVRCTSFIRFCMLLSWQKACANNYLNIILYQFFTWAAKMLTWMNWALSM